MRVILTMNNQPADLEAGYALRLIEQGRAIPAPKQPAGEEARAEEILSQRTVFKHGEADTQESTPLNPPCEGGQDTASSISPSQPQTIPPLAGGAGGVDPSAGAKPRRKSSKKAGDSNVAG